MAGVVIVGAGLRGWRRWTDDTMGRWEVDSPFLAQMEEGRDRRIGE